ncbi:MAG: VOC family protein [Thermoplasmata archaeon]|nr:VOC family protein [Thermoplasmata archaeon]MCI4340911.1 VOC family protein [Thermoplasmata archaeon]
MPLEYVGIRVRNLPRSLRFYTRVMGLKVRKRGDIREQGGGIWVSLIDPRNDAQLELNWYPRNSRFATKFVPGEALDHVGFLLGHVPRRVLEAEYRRVISRGARPTGIAPSDTDGWTAYVKDPDGNWVEIFRRDTAAERRAWAKEARASSRPRRTTTRRRKKP